MKSEYELIKSAVEDLSIDDKCKTSEYDKLKICQQCPDMDDCWNCGTHRWWNECNLTLKE